MDTIIQKLTAVANTLEVISVCGRQNLMRLSGCIDVVESVLKELTDGGQAPKQEVK